MSLVPVLALCLRLSEREKGGEKKEEKRGGAKRGGGEGKRERKGARRGEKPEAGRERRVDADPRIWDFR